MKKNRETVELADKSEVVVVVPSPSQDVEGRKVFNRKWKEYVYAGVMANKQLNDFLTSSGVLTPDREQKLEALQKEISDIGRKLKAGKKGFQTLEEGRAAALKSREKRMDMLSLLSESNEYAQRTAESMAEVDRFNYLLSVCAYKNDKLYFEDLEDYLRNSEEPDSYAIASKFATLISNYSEDTTLQTEEDKFLYKYGFVNDKGHLIRKDGQMVDKEGRLVNDKGRYIDEAGEFVDIHGNRIDEAGDPVVDFEDFVDESGAVITPKELPV